jgi:hypothetical protein
LECQDEERRDASEARARRRVGGVWTVVESEKVMVRNDATIDFARSQLHRQSHRPAQLPNDTQQPRQPHPSSANMSLDNYTKLEKIGEGQ